MSHALWTVCPHYTFLQILAYIKGYMKKEAMFQHNIQLLFT